jgi:hypothetical protein
MKTNLRPEEGPLDSSLREWRINTPLPPRFQEAVWRRIADAAPGNETTTLWAVFQNWFQAAFSRPAVAVAYALVLLCLGSGTGYWRAREKTARIESTLGSRYVQSVDPYQKTGM